MYIKLVYWVLGNLKHTIPTKIVINAYKVTPIVIRYLGLYTNSKAKVWNLLSRLLLNIESLSITQNQSNLASQSEWQNDTG